MKSKFLAASAAASLMLAGCASVIEGTTQSVAVTSPPVEGAKCRLENSEGTWFVTTPGNAQVHKTKTDLHVTCTKDGYQPASLTVVPHFNGATAGNILAGGVIGLGVDAATGANYNYPALIALPMVALGKEGQGEARSAAGACGLKMAGTSSLTLHPNGTRGITALVNNHEVSLLLDTAAPASVLSDAKMKDVGLRMHRLGMMDMPGGKTLGAGDTPDSAVIAGISTQNLTLYADTPPAGFDGTFALSTLQATDVELDFGKSRLNVFTPDHCSGNAAYWTSDPVAVVPFTTNKGGQMVISVSLDGKPVEAVLDSAAPVSHIQAQALKRSTGGSGLASFQSLDLEGVSVKTPAIQIDKDQPDYSSPYLFIGASVLNRLHIFVSNSEKRLYVTAASAH